MIFFVPILTSPVSPSPFAVVLLELSFVLRLSDFHDYRITITDSSRATVNL
ncbi:MAG: hypothetical protein AB1546_08270 [bacterium]